MGLKITAVPR